MALGFKVSRAFVRQMSSGAFGTIEDGAKKVDMWRNTFFFVAIPALVLAHINCYILTKEEKKHFVRPPFVKYDCMRIRVKPYPWGDGQRTLFHNPKVNALPDGYEDEL